MQCNAMLFRDQCKCILAVTSDGSQGQGLFVNDKKCFIDVSHHKCDWKDTGPGREARAWGPSGPGPGPRPRDSPAQTPPH